MLDLADGHGTDDPLLSAILRARAINSAFGGAFVTPWDVNDSLPEEYVEAAFMLQGKAQRYAQARAEIEAVKERLRQQRKH